MKRPSFVLTFLDGTLYREPGACGPSAGKWYGMEQYGREFALSENWWKGMVAIEKMMFLNKFGRV